MTRRTSRISQAIPKQLGSPPLAVGILLTLFTILLLASCARPPKYDPAEQMDPAPGFWDVVWAEPTIVAADSMFTLIQADWIDSTWVDEPPPPRPAGQTVLRFFIDDAECFVAINMVDNAGGLIRPLLAKKLRYGYYKLLIQTGSPVYGPVVERWVSLRYCDNYRQERLK